MRVSARQLQLCLSGIVSGWHPAVRRSFRGYVGPSSPTFRCLKTNQARDLPYWLVLPQWLAGLFLGKRRTEERFLSDAVCGQFCVFLALKIHDDVFDGQVQDRTLLFASDHLLLSARQKFAPYFSSSSSFWSFFDSSLAQTLNAIVAVDECQIRGYGSPSSVAALARQGYAACNIAAYAICLQSKRVRLFHRIVRCTDELAFVGQSLDDMQDMMVDFQRGRVNYAAYFLLGRSSDRRKNFMGRLARRIILDGSAERFFEMLQRHLERAREIAATTAIPMLVDYVRNHRLQLQSIETQWHRKRVQMLFESALKRQR